MKVNLEQLEEMQKELFKQQCDLDIQKAMVKHFIKKEKDKQLTLTDVSQQRELFYNFITWYNAKPNKNKDKMIYINTIEDYLKL